MKTKIEYLTGEPRNLAVAYAESRGFEPNGEPSKLSDGNYWITCYHGHEGWELGFNSRGEFLRKFRVPQIDCTDDDD